MMTSYTPLYSWPLSDNEAGPAALPIPHLLFATTYSFDIDYAYTWRDKIKAEYCQRYNLDLHDYTRPVLETRDERILREAQDRIKELGPFVYLPNHLGQLAAQFSHPELLGKIKKRISWQRLLGGVPTRAVALDFLPGRRKLVDGHFMNLDTPYVTDADRKDWDDVCDACDLELMKLALSFVDSVPGLDGIFQDADYGQVTSHVDLRKDAKYGSIYTIADLRKNVSEGTPRRMTEAWLKGRERLKNPFSEWKYWLGV